MIDACQSKEEIVRLSQAGQEAFQRIESSPKPIVAAIMGPALGGGLEVTLTTMAMIVNTRTLRL
jgi:enoyl-CoA hydratase/carnithine racemase